MRLFAVLSALSLIALGTSRILASDEPRVVVLSVGQGAAVLLQAGSTQILYDTGPDGTVLEALNRHVPAWDHNLELLILSHLHTDHIGGADEVLGRYTVNETWWNGALETNVATKAFLSVMGAASTPTLGDTASIGPFKLEVLHPPESVANMQLTHAHDGTLVLRATAASKSVLLTGDLETSHLRALTRDCDAPCPKLKADVLMLSHHGSRNATSAKLLDAVEPALAFVCVGKRNRYHHPHQETLELIEKYQIPLHRTDLHGDLVVVFRPSGIAWQRSTGPPL